MLHHERNTIRQTLCFDCTSPACTASNCLTCRICRDPQYSDKMNCQKPLMPIHNLLYPKNLKDKQVFKCLTCSGAAIRCDVCEEVDPAKFSASMVSHRSHNNQRTLCLDCTNPACTASDCTTCRTCRNPACKRTDGCEKPAAPLHSSQYPKSMADKLSFRCSACRKMKCSRCKTAATKKQIERYRKKDTTEAWTCGDCLTTAVSQEELRNQH